jgi:hypothetical protein
VTRCWSRRRCCCSKLPWLLFGLHAGALATAGTARPSSSTVDLLRVCVLVVLALAIGTDRISITGCCSRCS